MDSFIDTDMIVDDDDSTMTGGEILQDDLDIVESPGIDIKYQESPFEENLPDLESTEDFNLIPDKDIVKNNCIDKNSGLSVL